MQMVRTPQRSVSLPPLAATKKSFFAPLPETKKDIFRGTTLFGICLSIKQYICPLDSLNGGIPANPTVHSDWQLQGQFICIPQLPCTNRQLSAKFPALTIPLHCFYSVFTNFHYSTYGISFCQCSCFLLLCILSHFVCSCLHFLLLYIRRSLFVSGKCILVNATATGHGAKYCTVTL